MVITFVWRRQKFCVLQKPCEKIFFSFSSPLYSLIIYIAFKSQRIMEFTVSCFYRFIKDSHGHHNPQPLWSERSQDRPSRFKNLTRCVSKKLSKSESSHWPSWSRWKMDLKIHEDVHNETNFCLINQNLYLLNNYWNYCKIVASKFDSKPTLHKRWFKYGIEVQEIRIAAPIL